MKRTSDATHPANRIEVTVWLSAKEAAKKLSVSTDTIERRAIPWQDAGAPYKVRYKLLVLDESAEPIPTLLRTRCRSPAVRTETAPHHIPGSAGAKSIAARKRDQLDRIQIAVLERPSS